MKPTTWAVFAVDRAGNAWDVISSSSPEVVLAVIDALRHIRRDRVYGIYDLENPERGDQEMAAEEAREEAAEEAREQVRAARKQAQVSEEGILGQSADDWERGTRKFEADEHEGE